MTSAPIQSESVKAEGEGKLELRFGPLAPPLAHQLAEQGYVCKRVDEYEADRKAVHRLRFSGALTDGEARKAFERIMAGIRRSIARSARTANQKGS